MRWAIAGAVVGAAISAPAFASPFIVQFLINLFMLASLAAGWNIIGGFAGYASFGNAGFFGVGAYVAGVLLTVNHWPFAFALPAAGLAAMLFGALIGEAVLGLEGQYFAIATLGVAETTREIVFNLPITGGGSGMTLPMVRSPLPFYYLMLAILVLATLATWWISRSRFGFGLLAIREDENAAAAMGIPTSKYKTIAFSLSGLFTGLAGAVFAYWITFIDPNEVFKVSITIQMIIMAVFGGAGTVLGPVLGAAVLATASELLSTHLSNFAELFNGVIVILVVLFMPKGMIETVRKRQFSWRHFLNNLREYEV